MTKLVSRGDIEVEIALHVFSGLLILSGGIWFLKGINILPGSFMSGDPQWSINGVLRLLSVLC